jgi:hypothetical protein
MTTRLPALFIGSSTEGLNTAYAVQQAIEYDAESTVWTQGIFQPSQNTLSTLVENLPRFEFAAFVFSPDDTVKLRGTHFPAVRDNVIFELGLFMGALGPGRCFCLVPRNVEPPRLPSDLAGITTLSYNAARTDGNLLAALGPACNDIRKAIKLYAMRAPAAFSATEPVQRMESPAEKLQRYLASWNGEILAKARQLARNGVPMSIIEVDKDSQPEWDAFRKIFYFLESLSSAVLAGEIESDAANKTFGVALTSVWKHASTALAMPNHADDIWNPPPNIAQVYELWNRGT